MQYTVKATIQSGTIDKGEPVDVQWYTGNDLAVAITAMAQAATCYDDDSGIPESVRVRTLSVHMDMTSETPAEHVGVLDEKAHPSPYGAVTDDTTWEQ